jgi:ribonuclease HI
MVKINWDAALDKNRRTIDMGMIARDGEGSFLAVASKVLFLEADLVVAETLAATHALIFCHELGFQHVIF